MEKFPLHFYARWSAASVKAVTPRDLKEMEAKIVLANTYHLYLRRGTPPYCQKQAAFIAL